MGLQLNSAFVPQYKSIKSEAALVKKEITDRKEGKIKSLSTPFKVLNDACVDGLEWNSIVSICGTSSSGKSAFLEFIKDHFMKYDKSITFLNYECEMTASAQILRGVARRTGLTMKQLKNVKGFELNEEETRIVLDTIELICDENVHSINHIPTIDEIINNTLYFVAEKGLKAGDRLIISFDYVQLIKSSNDRDTEKRILDNLYAAFVELKKVLISLGIDSMILALSQMNRGVFSAERTKNPLAVFPNDSDLAGSSAIMNGSDLVIVTMNPSRISALANLNSYGPFGWPIKNHTGMPMIYGHIMKNRSGTCDIIQLVANFSSYRFMEVGL